MLLITALGAAAALAKEELQQTAQHMAAMRDQLQEKLVAAFGAVSSHAGIYVLCSLSAVPHHAAAAECISVAC